VTVVSLAGLPPDPGVVGYRGNRAKSSDELFSKLIMRNLLLGMHSFVFQYFLV